MTSENGYRAIAKYLPISPFKIRPIANIIRNYSYLEAEAVLLTLPNKGAMFLLKVLRSAAANALYRNKEISEDSLILKELIVNEGARQKRIWARGRGRADRQLKRYSHIGVVLNIASSREKG